MVNTAEKNAELLKSTLLVMKKYLSLIYKNSKKYRPIMDENEVIDTIRIIAWQGEDDIDRLVDWITWARSVPC